jgi:two-component system chemotaxis response regulator CheB
MPTRDIVVVGASAGGVDALCRLVGGLPADLPAAVLAVCHLASNRPSALPAILERCGELPAAAARDGELVRPGRVYVAPPDHHLLVKSGVLQLSRGPRENHYRPAIDPLFRSAARDYGPRVVAVVLTGALNDGTAGLLAVRAAGGVAVVQDPRDSFMSTMPENARVVAGADHVVPVGRMPALITELVARPAKRHEERSMTDPIEKATETVNHDMAEQIRGDRRGEISLYTCPECGGSLWQLDENDMIRFRCHTGHAYYGETLLGEQEEALEAGLWIAVRTFKEKAVLSQQMAAHHRARGKTDIAERFEEDAHTATRYAGLIQQYLLEGNRRVPEPAAEGRTGNGSRARQSTVGDTSG